MQLLFKYGLAVVRDGRLLLCRPRAFSALIMPGGLREGEETAADGIGREVVEELGPDARVRLPTLQRFGVFEDRAAGRSDAMVKIELYVGEVDGMLVASSEIAELIWFDPIRDDASELSAIVRNKIIPALQADGIIPS
jgi:ADP-ribose pyrophosphatase YjhB (NUDIX family)